MLNAKFLIMNNGQTYFQLPDGTITQETPKEYKKVK